MVRTSILAFCLALAACGSTATQHIEWGLMGSGGSFRFQSGSGVAWSFAVAGSDLTVAVGAERLVLVDAVPAAGVRFLTRDLDTPDITFGLRDDLVVHWHGRSVRIGDVSYEIGPTEQRVPVARKDR